MRNYQYKDDLETLYNLYHESLQETLAYPPVKLVRMAHIGLNEIKTNMYLVEQFKKATGIKLNDDNALAAMGMALQINEVLQNHRKSGYLLN